MNEERLVDGFVGGVVRCVGDGCWVVVWRYETYDELKEIVERILGVIGEVDKENVIVTGVNLAHTLKICPQLAFVTNTHHFDMLKQTLAKKPKNYQFYTKKPISPAEFIDSDMVREIQDKRCYIDFDTQNSFYILDIRDCCRFYHHTDKQDTELLLETKNGERSFYTLKRLLTQQKQLSLTEIVQKGNNYNVDKRVRDIYGSYCQFLPVDIIAASLGKTLSDSPIEDVLKSIIFVLAINICGLLSIVIEEQKDVLVISEELKHDFTELLFSSLIRYYTSTKKQKTLGNVVFIDRS